jgi:hypothetical protein
LKGRFTIIEFPVLSHYVVHVEIAADWKKAMTKYPVIKKDYEKKFVDHDDCPACAIHVGGENFSFIFFKPNPSINDIVHECWHVIARIFEHVGAKLDRDEMVAYHLAYLTEKVFKFVRRRK